jgi:hypothetical protein
MTISPIFGNQGFEYWMASINLNGRHIIVEGDSKKAAFLSCIAAMVAVMSNAGGAV